MMLWIYFDLVQVDDHNYHLVDVDENVPLENNGDAVIFHSFSEAEQYLVDSEVQLDI